MTTPEQAALEERDRIKAAIKFGQERHLVVMQQSRDLLSQQEERKAELTKFDD